MKLTILVVGIWLVGCSVSLPPTWQVEPGIVDIEYPGITVDVVADSRRYCMLVSNQFGIEMYLPPGGIEGRSGAVTCLTRGIEWSPAPSYLNMTIPQARYWCKKQYYGKLVQFNQLKDIMKCSIGEAPKPPVQRREFRAPPKRLI